MEELSTGVVMVKILQILTRLSQYQIVFLACILLLIVGYLDYVTGVEVSVSIFYLIPIAMCAWFLSKWVGIIASLSSALVWCSLDFLASEKHYSHPLIPYWNALVMFSFFLVFALMLSAFKKRLELEDALAKEVQRGLFPHQFPQVHGYDIFGLWQPARTVSGDYFDVLMLDDRFIGFCIGDVIGHGIPAAILMSNLQASVRRTAVYNARPEELCFHINNFVIDNLVSGKFITFFYGILDIQDKTFTYTNAGHNPPILFRNDGTTRHLTNDGFMLGIERDFNYPQSTIQLLPGDLLELYTDGVTEMKNSQNEWFGEERLIETLSSSRSLPANEICHQIMKSVMQFGNNNIQDDITLLTLSIMEQNSSADLN